MIRRTGPAKLLLSLMILSIPALSRASTDPLAAIRAGNARTDFEGAVWDKISDGNGIDVYRWEVPGSDVVAFKGVGEIDAPVAKVAQVLLDTTRAQEWVPDFGGVTILREVSKVERIQYIHVRTPFVIKDRDFVVYAKAEYDPKDKVLDFRFRSIEDPAAPPSKWVRGDIRAGLYRMTAIDGGKRTRMVLMVHLDPMGTVPRWIVNLTQRNYPRATIENVRRQAAKADVPENPQVKSAMENPGNLAALSR